MVLADTDVVFSAHVSRHGAIPATIVPWVGAEVDAWLLAVPAGAIDALDATEPNYVREDLDSALPATSRATGRCGSADSPSRSPTSPRAGAGCAR